MLTTAIVVAILVSVFLVVIFMIFNAVRTRREAEEIERRFSEERWPPMPRPLPPRKSRAEQPVTPFLAGQEPIIGTLESNAFIMGNLGSHYEPCVPPQEPERGTSSLFSGGESGGAGATGSWDAPADCGGSSSGSDGGSCGGGE